MKKKDVLLIARPDHSLQIFDELKKSSLTYVFFTFKVFPGWVRRIVKNPKVVCLSGDVKSSILMTVYNILVFKYRSKLFSRIAEYGIFERFLSRNIRHIEPKLVHYWPKYSKSTIKNFKAKNSNIKTIAEIYMPNEQFIIDYVEPILKPLGLDCNLDYVRKQKKDIEEVMTFETDFLVPSKFVADSHKKFYPDKKFHIVPYGISVWKRYHKKLISSNSIRTFVYAGTISVEKGCDMICEFFSTLPEMELHLYGRTKANEDSVFEKYKNVSNIHFHGAVARSILQEEMSQYDVGIHMSLFDAYSLSVGEMIGAGLPVIVSENTGIKDDVEKNDFGLVCTLNRESLEDSVRKITTLECYKIFIDSIDKYIAEHHSNYGQKVVKLYEQLVSE